MCSENRSKLIIINRLLEEKEETKKFKLEIKYFLITIIQFDDNNNLKHKHRALQSERENKIAVFFLTSYYINKLFIEFHSIYIIFLIRAAQEKERNSV